MKKRICLNIKMEAAAVMLPALRGWCTASLQKGLCRLELMRCSTAEEEAGKGWQPFWTALHCTSDYLPGQVSRLEDSAATTAGGRVAGRRRQPGEERKTLHTRAAAAPLPACHRALHCAACCTRTVPSGEGEREKNV
jgi:hypothetical protein